MKTMKGLKISKTVFLGALLAVLATVAVAQQSEEILIRNATIMTASRGTIENGSILIINGKIAKVGKVAEVTAECQDGVFQSTQHIDRPWTARTNVKPCRDRVRSTSVGDVVVEGRVAYRCEVIGWTSHTINR